ncbi:MAG: molybdenum cofactor biosynthesis protein MoaE, partial [Acidobacteriota bacterium]|nr:molybdenum cofactor biosynthesis protein MoaE [Acidobacteriota bacterium]
MYLTDAPIDPASLTGSVRPSDGGVCTFVGVVRDHHLGRPTSRIQYEAYGPMAEAEIAKILEELAREWPETRVLVLHRVGVLEVGDVAVAIVASAPHRAEAFSACRAAIDRIKKTVPIWKREFHPDGTSDWVDPTAES